MYLGEFLNLPSLVEIEQQVFDSPERFSTLLTKAEVELFGKQLDPIIYTAEKKFTKSAILMDKELNKKGLHLFRYIFSTYATKLRSKNQNFIKNGSVRIENFLPDDIHKQLQQECKQFDLGVNNQGYNNCNANSKNFPALHYIFKESNLQQNVFDCIGCNSLEAQALYKRNTFVQRVHNTPTDGDIQKFTHSDTFFPAIKWWYFPDAVELGQGPFKFQQTAPKYDNLFLTWLHKQSVDISHGTWPRSKGKGHIQGSLRITDSELEQIKVKMEPVTVPANTLVMANVQLFHGRGDTTAAHTRNAVHGSIRISKPFLINF